MLKLFLSMLLCFQVFPIFHNVELVEYGESAVLMDTYSGQVMYEKDAYKQLHPASMTKMMGMLLIYEGINDGLFNWEDRIRVSAHASSMGGSQIYLEENEEMSLEELFTAICVSSANDAMVAVSEFISGSETLFVEKMNQKVDELGLVNTHFSNSTGLDIDNHYSCAYDMAIIAKEVLRISNEAVTNYTSLYETYLREDTSPFWLVNTNKLIRSYEGMDGLKTGFTQKAGYCLTATAKRNGMRLIAVVMKESTKEHRNKDIKALLDYGFANYKQTLVYPKSTIFDSMSISNGKPEKIDMICKEDVYLVHDKKSNIEHTLEIIPLVVQAPIDMNTPVGKVKITFENGSIVESLLYARVEVQSLNFIDVLIDCFIQSLL